MKFVTLSLTSKIVTTENGGWKNWASCHASKPVRHGCLNRPPESQNRVQTIRADTRRTTASQPGQHHPSMLVCNRDQRLLITLAFMELAAWWLR